jgi:hypothetical protein
MTQTTNMSSAESPATYATLARECDRLAAIARQMDKIASERDAFLDDADFQRMRAALREALGGVESLEQAIPVSVTLR